MLISIHANAEAIRVMLLPAVGIIGSALDVRNLPPFAVMTGRGLSSWMLHNEPNLTD